MRRHRIKRKANRARAFILVSLVLNQVLQARPQECGKPTPPLCKDDCTSRKLYHDVLNKTGNGDGCQPCPECGPGFKLTGICGGSEGFDASCEPVALCPRGKFYDGKREQCSWCRFCDNTVGDVLCNATHDTVCGPCRPGYYHLENHHGLCHSCDLHLNPQTEPQCQMGSASATTPFLDNTSSGISPLDSRQDITVVRTATNDKSKDEMVTSVNPLVHTDGGSHPEQSTTESTILDEPVVEEGPPDQEDEFEERESTSDKGFPYASVTLYFIVGVCVLVFLGMLAFAIYKYTMRQRRRQQSLRRSQGQNYRGYVQGCIEEEAPDKDRYTDGTVSLNVLNDTARFQRATSPHLHTSSVFPPTRSQSHSNLYGNVFWDSVTPICNVSSGDLVGTGSSQHGLLSNLPKRDVSSPKINLCCDHMSTSMGSMFVFNEPEVFTIKPVAHKELAKQSVDDPSIQELLISHKKKPEGKAFQELSDERKPLMTEKGSITDNLVHEEIGKSLDREKNQPVENLNVAVQCPSLQNLASNDGTEIGDSDKKKDCPACSPGNKEKPANKSETKKQGNSATGNQESMGCGVPPPVSTYQCSPKCINYSVNCTGNNNKFIFVNNSTYNASCSSSDSDETE